jgi:multiple sugar transport system permease protein
MAVDTATRRSASTAERRGSPSYQTIARRRRMAIFGFLAPFGLLFLLFYVIPIGYAAYQSLFVIEREGPFGAPEQVFGGLQNYTRALQDGAFVDSVLRMLLFGIVQVPIMLGLALALALVLDSTVGALKRFFRLSYFAPYAVPTVIAAIMWGFLYVPTLSGVDLGIDPLSSGSVLWSIANIVTWTYLGYNMIILFAALQAIDRDLYEAARVDGAGGWTVALRIKVPLIRDALILTGVFSIIGTLQLFNEPQVLRNITTSISSTYTPNLVVYSAASANQFNYAAAIAFLLALVTGVLSFAFLKILERRSNTA